MAYLRQRPLSFLYEFPLHTADDQYQIILLHITYRFVWTLHDQFLE